MQGEASGAEDTDSNAIGKPEPGWSQYYIQYVIKNFDPIFQHMFEDKFLDRLFEPNDNNISKMKFITAVVGNVGD